MTSNNWTKLVREAEATKGLLEAGAAVSELAQHAPGKERICFQTVAEIALIGTAVIGAASESVHLWKVLSHRQHSHHKSPAAGQPETSKASPRHHDDHAASEPHYHRPAVPVGRRP